MRWGREGNSECTYVCYSPFPAATYCGILPTFVQDSLRSSCSEYDRVSFLHGYRGEFVVARLREARQLQDWEYTEGTREGSRSELGRDSVTHLGGWDQGARATRLHYCDAREWKGHHWPWDAENDQRRRGVEEIFGGNRYEGCPRRTHGRRGRRRRSDVMTDRTWRRKRQSWWKEMSVPLERLYVGDHWLKRQEGIKK